MRFLWRICGRAADLDGRAEIVLVSNPLVLRGFKIELESCLGLTDGLDKHPTAWGGVPLLNHIRIRIRACVWTCHRRPWPTVEFELESGLGLTGGLEP